MTAAHALNHTSVTDAIRMRDEGAIFLDVREQKEWNVVHIANSTLAPLSNFTPGDIEDKRTVIVCRSGRRAVTAGERLLEQGHTAELCVLEAGILAWEEEGAPGLVRGPRYTDV